MSNPVGGPRLDNISVIELVNDDMPFLVNLVMGELNHRGLEIPPGPSGFRVARDAAGKLIRFGNGIEAAPLRESIIQVHVDRIDDDAARSALAEALAGVVSDVRLAVQDWRSMLDRVGGIIDALKTDPPPLPEDDVTETIAFLEWLKDNNFTFLGVREYRLEADGAALAAIPSSTLGVLRGNQGEPGTVGNGRIEMSPPAKAAFEERRLMLITNTSARSRVHRRVPMDMIGIKRFRATAGRRAEYRSSVCSPRPPIPARPATSRISAARSQACLRGRGLRRTAIPARRSRTCSTPIPATSCSRSTRTRSSISR